CIRANRWW
ncbi:3-deoxy-7-phosphoheptulonate synthase, partial [Vibrio parahaemolyticus AQ3810]